MKKEAYLITGAGRGIGNSIMNLCEKKEIFTIAIVRKRRDLNKFKNSKSKVFLGDVTNLKLIKKIFSYCSKNSIYISAIINNAGERQRKSFLKITKNDLYRIFKINFFSIFFITQEYISYLIKKKKKGSIVNIGSIVGQLGFPELSGYGSTKSAVNGLTKCLAAEYGKKNLRFNVINPGFTKTSFYKNFKKKKKKLYKWTLSRIPQKRWANSEEVANLAMFLASSESSYINGENINIDGGWSNT